MQHLKAIPCSLPWHLQIHVFSHHTSSPTARGRKVHLICKFIRSLLSYNSQLFAFFCNTKTENLLSACKSIYPWSSIIYPTTPLGWNNLKFLICLWSLKLQVKCLDWVDNSMGPELMRFYTLKWRCIIEWWNNTLLVQNHKTETKKAQDTVNSRLKIIKCKTESDFRLPSSAFTYTW